MLMKRRLSIALAACLLAGLFSACAPGSSPMGPAEEPAAGSTAGSTAESPSEPSREETAEGEAGDGYRLPLCEPGTESLTMLTYQNWHASSYYDAPGGLPVENKLEEITGVKIIWECVPSDDYDTVAQTRLAAGTGLPDIMRIPKGATGLARYSAQGVLDPISNYMNEADTPHLTRLLAEKPIYRAYMYSPDGNIYGLPHAEYDVNQYVLMWNIIREDWLENVGLDMPATIDEYYNVLVAFRDGDPNGNGLQDEVPQGYQNDNMFGLYTFKEAFGFNNTDIWSIDENGTVAFDLMDEKFLDCLTTLHQWYEEGLLSATVDGSDSDSLIAQDRLGAQTVSSSDNLIGKGDLVRPVNPDGRYVFIPPLTNPAYPDNNPRINKRQDFHDYYCITVDCANPKLAAQWMDWVYASDDSVTLRYWGIEGETYQVENGEKVFLESVTHSDTSAIDVLRNIGGFPNFVGHEHGEPLMAMYRGTYVEEAYNTYKDVLIDRVPTTIGTEEESNIYSSRWPDIETYMKESVVNFITGTRSLSEWDDYVEALRQMGIDEVVRVKQSWADRADELIAG